MRTALAERPSGFTELAKSGDEAELLVSINAKDQLEVRRRIGGPALDLRPPLEAGRPDIGLRLLERLEHFVRYQNVRDLANHDLSSPLQGCLQAELCGLRDDYDPADLPEPLALPESAGLPVFATGKWFGLRIRNQASIPLNLVIFNLGPRWSIQQLRYQGNYIKLESKGERVVPMKASLADGYSRGRDIIKVIATVGEADFRWLELPPLDQALPTRDVFDEPVSPLGELMKALAVDVPSREVEVPLSASHEWFTAEVEVEVERGRE